MKDVAFIGVPLYTLAKYAGMGRAPAALRGVDQIRRIMVDSHDLGDVQIDALEVDTTENGIKNFSHFMHASERILDVIGGIRGVSELVCLGGECSFAPAAIGGLRKGRKGKAGMLWIDAHGDFNVPETSPSGFIGGMCLAIACGRGPEIGSRFEKLRPLLDEARLIHVASRALDPLEVEAMRSSPLGLYTMRKVSLLGTKEVARQASARLADSSDWIACHLDLDALDPSIIPAVNYPTPGGMGIEQVVSIIKALERTGKLAMLDVAGYNPDLDANGTSAKEVARMLQEVLA